MSGKAGAVEASAKQPGTVCACATSASEATSDASLLRMGREPSRVRGSVLHARVDACFVCACFFFFLKALFFFIGLKLCACFSVGKGCGLVSFFCSLSLAFSWQRRWSFVSLSQRD